MAKRIYLSACLLLISALASRAHAAQRAETTILGAAVGPTACEDGIVGDDGTFENFYGWDDMDPDASYSMVMEYGDPTMSVDRVCVWLTRTGPDAALDGLIDFFLFDIEKLEPAPLPIASFSVEAQGVPVFPDTQFYSFPIGQPLGLTSIEPLSVSLTWNPADSPGFFLCADETAPAGKLLWVSKILYFATGGRIHPFEAPGSGFVWLPLGTPGTFPDYQALSLRAVLPTERIFFSGFELADPETWDLFEYGAP